MLKGPRERVSFRDREEIIDLPSLIEVQLKSFKLFFQADRLPHERDEVGLEQVFREIFPIKSYDEKTVLEYISYHLGAARYSSAEALRRGTSYSVPLKVKLRLTDETGIKEEEAYMGMFPVMTETGTFVINGSERVVVSQLHRSPGLSFEKEMHAKGVMLYSFRIIPYRGSWLEASFDINDLIYIYVDRKKRRRKVLATSFIRTLGYSSDADIIEEFFDTFRVKIGSEKDFSKLVGKVLAEDVVDEETGVVFGKTAEKLTMAMLKRMLDAQVGAVRIAEGADESSPIIKMLVKDPTNSYESALKDFYRKIRPGEPATLANARSAIMRLYFDPVRYHLGKVGRYKLNSKIGVSVEPEDLGTLTLRKEDIIGALKYLIRLKEGDPEVCVDDIDHLGNRRVRSVGELVQNQCRIGLARMEKIVRERMNLFDFSADTLTPGKLVSSKGIAGVIKDFFSRSQLSQFLDQVNPVSAITHKRRLSSLGPGGVNRERAGFEVRDVHSSHYGRVCPIETPEGPNIGLIVSLASYAKINEFGFIETPYRLVRDGIVTEEIEYMTADREERSVIAQASALLDEHNMFSEEVVWARYQGEPIRIESTEVAYMDVSPKQLASVVTGLIPFLEHDDANRALMGSNMQRQAVPLIQPKAPLVGTGMEKSIAVDSGATIHAIEEGVVSYVDGLRIVVDSKEISGTQHEYCLKKFMRSNAGTNINQIPICRVGDRVKRGDLLADGPSTERGEIALGRDVLVAFMPWCGYNFEDAIVISEKLIREDAYTSVHLQEFELIARDTKLGKEEITRDIPNVSEEALKDLGEDGIIRVGAHVKPGDILVGKITPKAEMELSPEERLLRVIFGETSADVNDTSLTVPPGVEGVVRDVIVFNRLDRLSKTDEEVVEERSRVKDIREEIEELKREQSVLFREKLGALLLKKPAPESIMHRVTGEALIMKGDDVTQSFLDKLEECELEDLTIVSHEIYDILKGLMVAHRQHLDQLDTEYASQIEYLRKGDISLDSSAVICQVKVIIATKRRLSIGDKMAGRHGNKGVVSSIVLEADMPFLSDGQTIEMILNPLGVPSRMNAGQVLEIHLGLAAYKLGIFVKCPIFEGVPEEEIWKLLTQLGYNDSGKLALYDGRTGERFDHFVTVGYSYIMKLNHLVDHKIHARSIGPYSLVTQQPLGGKAQMGGQRFGEMEVWALEAYGAAHVLQEMLTVKSDDVVGRARIYESVVKGVNTLSAGTPASFNVLLNEIRALGLDIQPVSADEDG